MIPLKDDNPTAQTPILTIALIAVNILVFFFWQERGSALEQLAHTFQYAAVPHNITTDASESRAALVVSNEPLIYVRPDAVSVEFVTVSSEAEAPTESMMKKVYFQQIPPWQTLFLSMFMHGSFMHILGNMWFLWIFGNNVEDILGKGKFLLFYLGTGLVASFGHIFSDPSSLVPTLGASGAVSGVLGGYLLLFPKARVLTIIPLPMFYTSMYLPAFVFLLIWLAMQVTGVLGADSGVAWWAHIGGFIAGALLVKLLAPLIKNNQPHRFDFR